MKRTEKRMWEVLEDGTMDSAGLRQIAEASNPGAQAEVALIVAIIVQAAIERDHLFFEDGRYRDYAEIAGINRHATMNIIEKIWESTDE